MASSLTVGAAPNPGKKRQFSGIYPHLAFYNNENECGTGAVVPWADRLWVVTYGPHFPRGSSDKLYEIDVALTSIIRPESIGGTPANRMIHKESGQLFIGPYAIDKTRRVRVIPYTSMMGRHTATMRHLTDPAHAVYYATMEEGFYEVDVETLAVKELYRDANDQEGAFRVVGSLLPGYHGKGAYTGQARVVYSNNGETSGDAKRAEAPAGVLAEWDGKNWTVVRRNQFTDVTGPGGIYGNAAPDKDPVWSIGWDHRSLILMLLDGGTWHAFRLPKASHTYDAIHGWNTEWPRIREIGEGDGLLMTMHGTFWRFPKTFSAANTAGIKPRSTYLKVIGDFARWKDWLVFGCDDTAKSEFKNKRSAKGQLAEPGQSQSNLWFADVSMPDRLGPALGRGGVWVNDAVRSGQWSDPFLFNGYDRRAAHLSHGSSEPVTFDFETDHDGRGSWSALRSVAVPAGGYSWIEFPQEQKGEWIRARTDRDATKVTVWFHYANADRRPRHADAIFDGVAELPNAESLGGLIWARGENERTLSLAAMTVRGKGLRDVGYYELDGDMKLTRVADENTRAWMKARVAIPQGVLDVDAASVLYRDDEGRRWRLPKGDPAFDELTGAGLIRMDREVVTERDLFNAHGTFYELPGETAGGFAKIRPITTHNRRVMDYGSYRGLLVLTGISGGTGNHHVLRSDDGKAAVWIGAIDDLWKLGKPVGRGGPWKDTSVNAKEPSDPYLMTGYDEKRVTLSQTSSGAVTFDVEIDMTGDGHWVSYRSFDVPAGGDVVHEFPRAFQAYWVRVTPDKACTATAWFTYD